MAYERIANVAQEIAQEEMRHQEERGLAVQAARESRKPALSKKESTAPVTTLEEGAPYHWRADADYTVRDPADPRRVVSSRMNIRADETEREGHKRRLEKKAEVAIQRQQEREQAQELLRRRLRDVQYCSALCQAYYDAHCSSFWLLTRGDSGKTMFIPLVGDLAPLWLEEISRAMMRRSNLEMETARQMFLAVREVMQRFATHGTVAQQSLIQRFYLNDEPPRSRNPGLEACFRALRAESDFGARAIAHYVRAAHAPKLPNLYAVSATIDRVVETVIHRFTEEPVAAQGSEATIERAGAPGAPGDREAGAVEPMDTESAEQAEPAAEGRKVPCVTTSSQATAFELTTGTFDITAEGQLRETAQQQAALTQLALLMGPSQAIRVIEQYVAASEQITLAQARDRMVVEVPIRGRCERQRRLYGNKNCRLRKLLPKNLN